MPAHRHVSTCDLACELVRPGAGCAHQVSFRELGIVSLVVTSRGGGQVSNESGCIKIATDFLCVEGISATIEVSEELRKEREEGLLSVEAMLWHAWACIHRQVALAF